MNKGAAEWGRAAARAGAWDEARADRDEGAWAAPG